MNSSRCCELSKCSVFNLYFEILLLKTTWCAVRTSLIVVFHLFLRKREGKNALVEQQRGKGVLAAGLNDLKPWTYSNWYQELHVFLAQLQNENKKKLVAPFTVSSVHLYCPIKYYIRDNVSVVTSHRVKALIRAGSDAADPFSLCFSSGYQLRNRCACQAGA